MVEFYYIDWETYGGLVARLTEKVRSSGKKFDLIVGIARGGIPVAMVIADQLGVKIDIINVKSYTGISKRSKPRIISTLTENVKRKRVLVVDDLIDEGDTMDTVIDYLRRQGVRQLDTAVLFKKPWSRFDPEFYLEVLEKWVVFPWEHGEVARIRESPKSSSIQSATR
jgi:hypoxanthine phosphoribosyltransferase